MITVSTNKPRTLYDQHVKDWIEGGHEILWCENHTSDTYQHDSDIYANY